MRLRSVLYNIVIPNDTIMKKFLSLIAIVAFAVPTFALAATFHTNTNVPAGETVVGNLYLVGGTPTINGNVQGDLYVAGGTVVMTGSVVEDLVTAGGNISVTGSVGGDVRAFGGTIFIDSVVNGEVIVSGGEVIIGPNAQIRKDLVAAGGTVDVDKNAKIYGSQMIEADKEHMENVKAMAEPFAQFAAIGFWIAQAGLLLMYFVVAAVFLGLFPNVLKKWTTKGLSKGQFWPSLGLGFALMIGLPISSFILMASGVGALLGALLMLVFVLYVLLNLCLAGILFGEWLKKVTTKTRKVEPSWKWGLGGIALLHAITLVPFIGWLIGLVFFLYSWGTMATVDWKVAKSLK